MRSSGNRGFHVWEVFTRHPRVSYTLQEVRDSSYLDLLSIFGLEIVDV